MSDPTPQRVRVTGPPRRRPTRVAASRGRQIDAETRLGEIYLGSLLREQLRLAAGVLVTLAVGVGSLPLLFHLAPHLAQWRVLDIPLPWLLLGVLVYPFLALLGWLYIRAAERNERDFADLVENEQLPR
ncbi:hypothetical protein [Nocardioides sp.]|uniref:hypothetical protein n=1 Tax=Nocardioides sp. TaxID=35761 RepID=UPI0027347C87|nr:hypothetical protein [Nocardioides sp.]MDP3893420.1 hypothetical protein [Nocardioides sp.]